MNPRKIQFDLRLAQLGIIPMYVSFAYGTGRFFRMDLLSDEYDTTYQIIKKEFMITKIRILFVKESMLLNIFLADCQFIFILDCYYLLIFYVLIYMIRLYI